MIKTAVLGAGAWGIGLSRVLIDNGHEVTLWSVFESDLTSLRADGTAGNKLPGIVFPKAEAYTTDLEAAMAGKDILVLAVASPYVRSTCESMKPYIRKGQIIVSAAKGIEDGSYLTMTQIIEEVLPEARVCALSGPSHAEEVALCLPTTVVAASTDKAAADSVQSLFMNPVFRVYTSEDVLGVELGGALKNVIALAAGTADGLGYGDNCKAALMTRGIHEITNLALKMGAKAETLSGLSGIGDLIVTCTSVHSRNRRAGFLIGQGFSVEAAMEEVKQVVEGVYAAKAAYHLGMKYQVELPIIEQVNAVLFEKKDPRLAVEDLMMRHKKAEICRS
ncbi:MAG: NAD(P)-dependent glycerol-3-phosphate dehydrogenase [Lachnospiraceae bacterium]|nr:NAD(P)-dependent glycerol-3-phosphate dehydrogenase [Lachnospiraceae bacterium]